MKYLVQISVILLFVTSLSYFGYRQYNNKFFEELFYFGFKPVILISFIVYKYHYPEYSYFLSLAIIQASISIAWEVLYSIDSETANHPLIIGLLFGATIFLISMAFLNRFFR